MTPEEKAATARVSSHAASRINDVVEDISSVVRTRVRTSLAPLGLSGKLPMFAVDATHWSIHSAIRVGTKMTGEVAATALHSMSDPQAPSVAERPRGLTGLAAFGAAFGDTVPPALGPKMSVHAPEQVGNADAVAVFLHGLGGHEQQWGADYAVVCAGQGLIPVFLRYTTGKAIDENAVELDAVLRALVSDWAGAPLRRIVLVGHSMGGLVATRAIQTQPADSPWLSLVTDVVTLGTPFGGAPLERFADATLEGIIASSAIAGPIAALGHHRSVGIKDLGAGVREPLPEQIRHLAVVAAVGTTPQAPTSRILGDGIVPTSSARGDHGEAANVTVVELMRSHHQSLLNHPGVTELLGSIAASD